MIATLARGVRIKRIHLIEKKRGKSAYHFGTGDCAA